MPAYSRRAFLAQAAGIAAVSQAVAATPRTATKPTLAVLGSVWRPLSYLDLLASRFIDGHTRPVDGQTAPACRIGRLWLDQSPDNDESVARAAEAGFRRCRSLDDALDGDPTGVLVVAEHGNYPRTEFGQVAYPRHVWLKAVAEAFARRGRAVPVYCAKHFAYRPSDAWEIYRWAKATGTPLMAGSAVPHAPIVGELPAVGEPLNRALVIAHGPIEIAGFDALEALQALVERRAGGESGLLTVRCTSGPMVWSEVTADRALARLLAGALACCPSAPARHPSQTVGRIALPGMPATPALMFTLHYRDGLQATVLMLNGHIQEYAFAVAGEGQRHWAGRFELGALPGAAHFDPLAAAIDQFVTAGRSPQPLERTLLTTLAINSLMQSNRGGGRRLELATSETVAY